jgi:signal transduction histidine kinase
LEADVGVISVLFSFVIYNVSTKQLDTSFRSHYVHLQSVDGQMFFGQPFNIEAEITTAHSRLKMQLIYLNLLILLGGTAASYWLARRTLKPIEDSLDAQSRFTADASHELRTPLAAMQTEIEVALRGELDAVEARELLTSNLEEIAKLHALSDGLLRLARAHEQSPELTPVNLAAAAAQAAASLEVLAAQRGVTIEADLPAELFVVGDEVSLRELVVVLIDNALKYGGVDSVVTVSAHHRGRHVVLTVADQGPGIAAADLAHIFDRFYRADSSRHHKGAGGYGLGLAIARSIAEIHLGELSAANRPDGGAVFTLKLPIQDQK